MIASELNSLFIPVWSIRFSRENIFRRIFDSFYHHIFLFQFSRSPVSPFTARNPDSEPIWGTQLHVCLRVNRETHKFLFDLEADEFENSVNREQTHEGLLFN